MIGDQARDGGAARGRALATVSFSHYDALRGLRASMGRRAEANDETCILRPFLKWPGGKRWFVSQHAHVFPRVYGRYIEPFLGSGSVFFHLRPKQALLGDTNAELIAAYRGLRRGWKRTQALLGIHQKNHGHRHYYAVRQQSPRCSIERAARVIYLNRACFNGIYRVNRKGEFNVPKGTRESILFDTDDFAAAARLLRCAEIRVADFEELVDHAKRTDFVFADPPYTVRHNLNGFIKYNEKLFTWDDQVRLAAALSRARDRGAFIVSTNANHRSVRKLYKSHGFRLRTISRFSSISAAAENRRQFEELLILGR
jgi:DNA adenine methylase